MPSLAIVAVGLLTAGLTGQASATSNVLPQTFFLQNVNSGLALSTSSRSVTQQPLDATDSKIWSAKYSSNNTTEISLVNKQTGDCLDEPNWDRSSGLSIETWPCNNGANQIWILKPHGANTYLLVNKNSGLALDMPNWSKSIGQDVQQWPENGGVNQLFNFASLAETATASTPTSTTQKPVTSQPATPKPVTTKPTVASPAASKSETGSLPIQGNVVRVNGYNGAAISSANNSVQVGGTVEFPSGTYNVGNVGLKGGVLYHADSGVTFKADGTSTIFSCTSNCSDISIDGFTFDGGNVEIGSDGQTTNNVKIVNNTVRNIHTDGFSQSAGMFLDRLDNSLVSNNTLTEISGSDNSNGLRFPNPNRTTISNNTFTNLYQGMTIDPEGSGNGIDLVVSGNQLSNLQRMGMEIQGDSTNLHVLNNIIGGFGSNANQGIAMSVVTRGNGTVITGNLLSNGGNVGIETLGNGVQLHNNTISNYQNGVSISCTPGGDYSGNTFNHIGQYGPFGKDGAFCGGVNIGTNTVDGNSVNNLTVN